MFGIMDNHGTSGNDDEQQSQIPHELLLPRDVLSRTNWLYRVDALRVHDLREMEISYYLANFYLGYISRLLVMSTSILTYIRNPFMVSIRSQLYQVYDNVSAMLHLAYSEGLCSLLELISISYYPRQSIEHLFALHKNTFSLFSIPYRLKLLLDGTHMIKLVLVSFFVMNCFTCFNETPYFNIRPPTLEEYIPLDEILIHAPSLPNNVDMLDYRYN